MAADNVLIFVRVRLLCDNF